MSALQGVKDEQYLELAPWRLRVRETFFPQAVLHTKGRGMFERFVILVLVLNMVIVAMYDPYDRENTTQRANILIMLDLVCSIVYFTELFLHGLAFGFSRFLNLFRLCDVLLVVGNGVIIARHYAANGQYISLNTLRTVRIIRPFFTTYHFRSVRVLVISVTRSIYELGDVILLYLLWLMWFGVSAIYQFGGIMRNKCVWHLYSELAASNTSSFYNDEGESLVSFQGLNYTIGDFVCGGKFVTTIATNVTSFVGCTAQQTCDAQHSIWLTGYKCPWGFDCLPVENPYHGLVSFDNIWEAFLSLYTCVTFQLWYEVMFWTSDASDFLSYFFFLAVVIIGAYLIINLTVVIITVEFEKGKEKERTRLKELAAAAAGKMSSFADVVHRLIVEEKKKNVAAQQLHRPDNPNLVAASATAPEGATVEEVAHHALQHLEQELLQVETMDVVGESDDPDTIRLRRAQIPRNVRFMKWMNTYIVDTKWFNWTTILVILSNLGCLCYIHYGMSEKDADILEKLNLFFSIFFTVEALCRYLAVETKVYFMDFHNDFDLFIVIVCWIEIGIPQFDFPIVRGLRALRCIKLLKEYPSLYQWILFIAAATRTSPLILLMMSLMVFIFGCMAMQLLGGRLCGTEPEMPAAPGFCAGLPRANFDTIGQSMITSFQIVTADDWNFVMYSAMRNKGAMAAIPFVIFFYMGNYVLLSLLIGVLLSANSEEREVEEELMLLEPVKEATDEKCEEGKKLGLLERLGLKKAKPEEGEGEEKAERSEEVDEFDPTTAEHHKRKVKGTDRIDAFAAQLTDRNCCLVWLDNNRITFQRFIEHKATEVSIAIIIIVGSVAMGLESPISPPDLIWSRLLWYLDIAITIIYVIETIINSYAYGFISGYTSYLRRDWWNVMDFILVLISIVGVLLPDTKGSQVIRDFKIIRAFRPLRLVRHSPGMKIVLSSLIGCLVQLKNIVLITCMLFGIWGIVGVYLFKGKLQKCRVGAHWYPDLPLANCTNQSGIFDNDGPNFDHLGAAYVSLFQVATLEGWAAIMYRVMDVVGPGMPPQRDASPASSLYIIFIALFAGLFLMNLFVSVLIDAYNKTKRSTFMQRSLRLTREQNGWMLTNKRILRQLPLKHQKHYSEFEGWVDAGDADAAKIINMNSSPTSSSPAAAMTMEDTNFENASFGTPTDVPAVNSLRMKLREVVRSEMFMNFVLVIIFLNFLAMASWHFPHDEWMGTLQFAVNVTFTSLYVLEAAVKIYAESFKMYLVSRWNKLDFFVAIASVIGIFFEAFLSNRSSAIIRSVRTLRLARVARGKLQIDVLLSKFIHSLASLVYVGAVIILVFFVFAVVGIKGFGRIKLQPFGITTSLDSHSNFDRLDNAMLLLVRVMTGGNWGDIMDGILVQPPFCDPNIGECGVPAPWPQLYFIFFLIVAMFVLRNLLTAVLLDSFASSALNRGITKEDAGRFYKIWKKYDLTQKMCISPFNVLPFVRSLPATCALGFNKLGSRRRINQELRFVAQLKVINVFSPLALEDVVEVLCSMEHNVPAPGGRPFVMRERNEEDLKKPAGRSSTGCDEDTDTLEERYARCAALIMINAVIARKRAEKKKKLRDVVKQRRATFAAVISEAEEGSPRVNSLEEGNELIVSPTTQETNTNPTKGSSQMQKRKRAESKKKEAKKQDGGDRNISFDDLSSDEDDAVDYEVMNRAINDFDI